MLESRGDADVGVISVYMYIDKQTLSYRRDSARRFVHSR